MMPVLIASDDVDVMFSDEAVGAMAAELRLPDRVDRRRLAAGLRDAARLYLDAVQVPSVNQLHREVAQLHALARRRDYDRLAHAVAGLSQAAAGLLMDRGSRSGLQLAIPNADDLADPGSRVAACEALEALCSTGGRLVPGRIRPGGRRSRPILRHQFHAPSRIRNAPRRDAERELLMWLRVAWLEASEQMPPRTADRRKLGPFARLVKRCLRALGVPHVNVAHLINTAGR